MSNAASLLARLEQQRTVAVATHRKIVEAARTRLERVQTDIHKLRARALRDASAGKRYEELVSERTQLLRLIHEDS